VVVVLTDDQDLALGGWTPMRRTADIVAARGGLLARNWFVNTPVCCPSRAELLTGRHFHNLRVKPHDAGSGCMHVDEAKTNNATYAATFAAAGYATAYFGKFLNQCPSSPPRGLDCARGCTYFAYDGGPDDDPGSYVNATFFHYEDGAPHPVDATHPSPGVYQSGVGSDAEFAGYATSILGNKSVDWLLKQGRRAHTDDDDDDDTATVTTTPFLLTVGHRAPHLPATPAPWYATAFAENAAPRGPGYNASAETLAAHHWLIAQQGPITADEGAVIDELFRNRWRTLLSVDDAVAALFDALDAIGAADDTYVVLTSDHGYNLGEHRLPSCKLNVYDHDLRVPMAIVGPGIAPEAALAAMPASHVDLAPTLLGLSGAMSASSAGGVAPTYDGRDLSAALLAPRPTVDGEDDAGSSPITPVLVEYFSLGNVTRTNHLVDDPTSNTYRAVRVVDDDTGGARVDVLYAEFTAVDNLDNFTQATVTFREAFDVAVDPGQLHNIYDDLGADLQHALAADLDARWLCSGPACHDPLDLSTASLLLAFSLGGRQQEVLPGSFLSDAGDDPRTPPRVSTW